MAREAGGTWIALVLNAGLRFVAAFLAARILGASGFGTLTLALTVTGIGGVISGLGLSPGLLPFLSRARGRGAATEVRALARASILLAVTSSAAVGAIVFSSASWLGEAAFRNPDLPAVLRALTPLVPIAALTAVLATFLQGFLAVKERAWIENVVVTGVTVGSLAACWALGLGRAGVVAAMLAGPIAGIVCASWLFFRLAPRATGPSPRAEPVPARSLLASSWPLMGTSMLLFLLTWSDVVILGLFRDAGEVGVYGVCARLVTAVLLFHESVGQVFLPRMSDLFAAGDRAGMDRLYRLTSRWAIWPAMVAACSLILWRREILGLFGPGFALGAAPLVVLASAKAIAACTGMSGRVFAVTGRARLNLCNLLLMVAANVALNFAWVPRFGAIGAAAATCVSLCGVKILQVAQVGLLFRLLPWDRKTLVPVVGIGALASGFAAFVPQLDGSRSWPVSLAAFCACCAALFLVRGVSDDEREVWLAVRARLSRGART